MYTINLIHSKIHCFYDDDDDDDDDDDGEDDVLKIVVAVMFKIRLN